MKKALLAVLLVLAAPLSMALQRNDEEAQRGKYKRAGPGSLQQTARLEVSLDSKFAVPAYPLYAPELAAGEGKQETEAYCALCHSNRYLNMQPPLPVAAWEAEVNKMNKTFGANIPEGVSQKILQYLQTHYTPETRKQ